jgi:hypothetical protein
VVKEIYRSFDFSSTKKAACGGSFQFARKHLPFGLSAFKQR